MAGRIDWTDGELDKLLDAARSLWQQDSSESAIELIRKAQIVLPEGRRRQHLVALDNIPKYLRDKMIAEKVGRGWEAWIERQKPTQPSADERRLAQVADERDAAVKLAEEMQETVKSLRAEIVALKHQPKPRADIEVLQDFFAGILYKAQVWQKVAVKPVAEGAAPPVQEPPVVAPAPAIKHNPEQQGSSSRKFKIVVVGGTSQMHQAMHAELGDIFEMRYVDPRDSNSAWGDRLKNFKDPLHGKVYLWANYSQHSANHTLTTNSIPFVRFNGERKELIERIKSDAKL